jgi:GT2 family glycosyltransferase
MLLSIIILNYKTKHLVKQCLKNILALNLGIDYEIIVVDNNSGDGIAEMMRENFPAIKFIQTHENRGMGAGNNAGIKNASGEYILILNPDVVVLPGAIEKLLAFARANQKIGCVAPQLLNPNKTYQQSCYRFPTFFVPIFMRTNLARFGRKIVDQYLMQDAPLYQSCPINWARGSALIFRKNILDKINGFDERFFMYLEDTDLCRRLWQAGAEIWYLPEAKMIHYYFRESGGEQWLYDLTKKMAWIHIASWLKYFWKWKK